MAEKCETRMGSGPIQAALGIVKRDTLGRRNKYARGPGSWRILSFVMAAGLIIPVSSAAMADSPYDDGAAQSACAGIGLRPGETPFINCVLSLREGAFQAVSRAGRACAAVGFVPGTRQHAGCVGNLNTTLDGRPVGSD